MTSIQLLTLSLLLSTCLSARTRLRFFGANQPGGIQNWKASKVVRSEVFTICPADLPRQFTLVCFGSSSSTATQAEFFINGVSVRTERVEPFTIAGDFGGTANPWDPPSTAFVECLLNDGEKVRSTIKFVCDGVPVDPPLTAPPPTRPRPEEGSAPRGTPSPTRPRPVEGSSPRGTPSPTRPRPVEGSAPRGTPSPTRPRPVEVPASRPPTRATRPPSFDLGSGSAGTDGDDSVVVTKDCVRIPALAYDSADIGTGKWEKRGQSLAYKPFDSNTGIIPAGRVTATYKFRAPTDGKFGFTLDMDTSGGVDYNDVWVDFEGGFTLSKDGKTRTSTGWTKAYHNKNGRSQQVYSVDHNPHTMATRISLRQGTEYTVKVGGRSTKTSFFAVIMFPCDGKQCDGTRSSNNYWGRSRDKCARARR